MTAVIVTATTVIPLVFDLQRHHLDSRHLTKSPVPFTTSSFSKPFGSIFRMGITTCTNSILGSNSFVQYSAYNELTTTVSTSPLVLIARTLAFTADLTALSFFLTSHGG
jgi:hypothetical protein